MPDCFFSDALKSCANAQRLDFWRIAT